MELDSFF